jgi:hypothetical protein
MAGDRVTLYLKGTVPLDLYADAIAGLSGLVSALSKELAANARIEWVVEDLRGGSADATIIGLSNDMASVERVVDAYAQIGSSLQYGQKIPYSLNVQKAAQKIMGILNGKVSAVTLATLDQSYTVTSEESVATQERQLTTAFGSVEGVIHTLAGKDGLRFTLYDALFGRAVSCYFSADPKERGQQEELMRNSWEKRAIVQGLVTRDSLTDRPLEIRQISQVIPVISGDYRKSRGALAELKDETPAEQIIRHLRDG